MMAAQKKSRMTTELFSALLEHFNDYITANVGKANIHVLILDEHGSRVTLDVVEKANRMRIDIITLPTHTSHKVQPLDVSVFKSLKVQFQKERDIWQQRSSSRQASKAELAIVLAKAIESSFTESNVKARFCATGIWPLDASTICFEGMPCNHTKLVENTTSKAREDASPSEVPNSTINAGAKDEAILVLNNMAHALGIDTIL
ncbi:hypothetical protein L7F22_011016 [Adiantum nelumboides]|nr:hypothetical protein [Adiantum nelumboides]